MTAVSNPGCWLGRAPGIAALAAVLALAGTVGAAAHEIGTTRVSVIVESDQTYVVEVVTDATALADKLAAASGVHAPSVVSAADLSAYFRRLEPVFRRRLALEFDGAAAHPDVTITVAAARDAMSAPAATIRLTGALPAGARALTWSYGWTFASYALSVRAPGVESASAFTQWLDGGDTSRPISVSAPAPPSSRLEIAQRYLALGFTHIVPYGLDHMLFVVGIFLLTRRARSVLWQVSAFTVAHSITLGLSIYGVISVTPRLVEPLIAISIAYVAIENLVVSELKPWRVALVFGFGLLHGMGFAGALKELGLPRSEFATALITFNVGVEAGQLAVIAAAFLIVGWYGARHTWYRRRVVVPASALIACVALYWTVERLAS